MIFKKLEYKPDHNGAGSLKCLDKKTSTLTPRASEMIYSSKTKAK